ncbi:hypothetical protein, partial [Paenibacillus brevis]
ISDFTQSKESVNNSDRKHTSHVAFRHAAKSLVGFILAVAAQLHETAPNGAMHELQGQPFVI